VPPCPPQTPAEIMEDLLAAYPVPEEKEMLLYTYVLYTCGGGGRKFFFRIIVGI
jgi:hypothetical protein